MGIDRYQFFPTPAVLEVQGSDGEPIRVGGLPLLARFEFRWRLEALRHLIAQLDLENNPLTPQQLLDTNPEFKSHVIRCLELFQLPAEKISAVIAWQLLFGTGDAAIGPLELLEFPPVNAPQKDEGDAIEFGDDVSPEGQLFASLWSHTGNAKEALELASDRRMPGAFLMEVLSARNAIAKAQSMTPKEKQIAKAKRAAERDGFQMDPAPAKPVETGAAELAELMAHYRMADQQKRTT